MTRRGSLLFELMVTVALCAVGFVVVNKVLSRVFEAQALKTDVLTLCAWCHVLHSRAQAEQRQIVLLCCPEQNGYRVEGQLYQFSPQVCFGGRYKPEQVLGPPSHPTRPLSSFVTFSGNKIVFRPDGTTTAGMVCIGHRQSPCLYALSCSVSDPFFMRLYRYDHGTWVVCDRTNGDGS